MSEGNVQSAGEYLKKQKKTLFFSIFIIIVAGITMLFYNPIIAYGLLAGFIFSIINYLTLARIIDRFLIKTDDSSQKILYSFLLFIGYQARFLLIVITLSYMFINYGEFFGLSALLGMSVLKWTAVFENIEKAVKNMGRNISISL